MADWKSHKITRKQFLRQLLEYDRWMLPCATALAEEPMPFRLGDVLRNSDAQGATQLLLFSSGDTVEEFDALYSSAAMLNSSGWEVFSADLRGVKQVIFDQASHHELVIAEEEFPEWIAAANEVKDMQFQ